MQTQEVISLTSTTPQMADALTQECGSTRPRTRSTGSIDDVNEVQSFSGTTQSRVSEYVCAQIGSKVPLPHKDVESLESKFALNRAASTGSLSEELISSDIAVSASDSCQPVAADALHCTIVASQKNVVFLASDAASKSSESHSCVTGPVATDSIYIVLPRNEPSKTSAISPSRYMAPYDPARDETPNQVRSFRRTATKD